MTGLGMLDKANDECKSRGYRVGGMWVPLTGDNVMADGTGTARRIDILGREDQQGRLPTPDRDD